MIIPISFQLLAKQKSLHPRHRRNFRTPCHYGERREKMNIRQSARSSCEKNQNSVVGVSCFTRRRWKVAAPEYGAPNYFALTRLLNSTRGYPLCRTLSRPFSSLIDISAWPWIWIYWDVLHIIASDWDFGPLFYGFWVLLFYIKKYFLSLEIKINMFKWNY